MAFDLGHEHPGPGRYGLFTQWEWERGEPAVWTMDTEGRLWYEGEAHLEAGLATVTGLWDE